MFEAGELGDAHPVAVRLQEQRAHDVGDLGAEFAPLDGMAPELGERTFAFRQQPRHFRLAAGNERDVSGAMPEREADRLVGRGVAGVQRRDHVRAPAREICFGDGALDEFHALEAAFARQRAGTLAKIGAGFDANDVPAPRRAENEVVENESEIGFSGAEIGDDGLVLLFQQRVQGGAQGLDEVHHLLQLAPRILIEAALARQDMKRPEERSRARDIGRRPEIFEALRRVFRRGTSFHKWLFPTRRLSRPAPRTL